MSRNRTARQTAPLLAAALAFLLAAAWLYGRIYSIEADNSNLPQAAEAWLSRGTDGPPAYRVEPQASLDIGKQRFVLAELIDPADLSLGLLRLERGLNGRYKLTGCGWGGGSFRPRVVREGDRVCYLLGGRNRLLGIALASFTMEDDALGRISYRMEIPAGDYFLTMTEIDPRFQADREKPGSLRLYDRAGADVTERANP